MFFLYQFFLRSSVYMFVFCFLWLHVTLSFFIFNLCSIYQSSTALCVAASCFCSFIIFAAWVSAYRYKQRKTCPDFSLYTNKLFCVKIIVLFVFDFWFPLWQYHVYHLFYPFLRPVSQSRHHSSIIHHILSLLSLAVPFPLAHNTICTATLTVDVNGVKWSGSSVCLFQKHWCCLNEGHIGLVLDKGVCLFWSK